MSRLLDDFRRPDARVQMPDWIDPQQEARWVGYAQKISAILREPDLTVMLIDNVASYYFEASDQEHWDLVRDFPNLAPPYKQFWSEHRLPKLIHSKEKGDTNVRDLCPSGRVGILLTALDRHEFRGEGVPDNVKWIMWGDIWIDFGHHGITAQGPHGAVFFAIDVNGVLVYRPWIQTYCQPGTEEFVRSLLTWYHPGLLAVSFLHCKNVTLVENQEPAKLAKKYKARHGIAPAPYKTLIIEPLKQILRKEGRSDAHGLAKAMHICRGHFRDYRQGRGLFGKYHQLVWSPMTVRGTKGKAAPAREVEIKV